MNKASFSFRLKNFKLAILSIVTIIMLIAMMPHSYAASGYYFNGGAKEISNNGAEATIESQNPYVYSGSSISAWAMTCDDNYSNRYAQVGYLKYSRDSKPFYFYEYSYGTSTWYQKQLTSAPVTGTHHIYTVGCDSNNMYFKIDGTNYATCSLSSIPFSRNTVEVFTETHHTSDQNPGSVANPVTMGDVSYKSTSNVWTSTKCINWHDIGYGDLSTQRNNILSSGSYDWEVWDSRY